jgi:hypothetical protein
VNRKRVTIVDLVREVLRGDRPESRVLVPELLKRDLL